MEKQIQQAVKEAEEALLKAAKAMPASPARSALEGAARLAHLVALALADEEKPFDHLDMVLTDLEEVPEAHTLALRVLASLPGGDELGSFVEPLNLGWKEVEALGILLLSLGNSNDVHAAAARYVGNEEEEA